MQTNVLFISLSYSEIQFYIIHSFINTIIVSIKSFVKIVNNLVDVRGAEKGNDTQAPAVTGEHSN